MLGGRCASAAIKIDGLNIDSANKNESNEVRIRIIPSYCLGFECRIRRIERSSNRIGKITIEPPSMFGNDLIEFVGEITNAAY